MFRFRVKFTIKCLDNHRKISKHCAKLNPSDHTIIKIDAKAQAIILLKSMSIDGLVN